MTKWIGQYTSTMKFKVSYAPPSTPKNYFSMKRKRHRTSEDYWDWKAGEIFFHHTEEWAHYSFSVSNVEDRKGLILEGEKVEEYLTPSENVRIWDHLTMFDMEDIALTGCGFRAYSRVFKKLLGYEWVWGTFTDAIENMWDGHTVSENGMIEKITDRNFYVRDHSTLSKSEKKTDAKCIVFRQDLTKRFELLMDVPAIEENKETALALAIVSILNSPVAFDEDTFNQIIEIAEHHAQSNAIDIFLATNCSIPVLLNAVKYDLDIDMVSSFDMAHEH